MTSVELRQAGPSRAKKIAVGILASIYAGIAILAALMLATPGAGANAEINAAVFQGQVVGYFGCCATIPVLVAMVASLVGNRGAGKADFVGRLISTLFWVLLVLLPLQIVSLLVTAAGKVGTLPRP